MKTIKFTILFALLLSVFMLARGYLLAEVTNRIVAKVNSDIITLHDLNASIKKLTGLSAKELQRQDEKKFYQIRRAILDKLINQKIAEQQIIKLGIKVTAKDVEEAIEKVKRENNFTQEGLINSLKQEGVSLKEYKDEIEKEIERFQLVNYEVKSKIVITEEELKKEQPQIFSFLKTTFSCITLGFQEKGSLHYMLAPEPPKIHALIRPADDEEFRCFFATEQYLHVLFAASATVFNLDELLLALLQRQALLHALSPGKLQAFLDTYSLLTGNDYRRLKLFLQRVQPLATHIGQTPDKKTKR